MSETEQKNNTAGGDIVARDKIVINKKVNIYAINELKTFSSTKNKTSDFELKKNYDKIQNYINEIEEKEKLIGLEKKLLDAHMNYSVERALKKKEEAYKMCAKNSLHLEAIKITAHCLSSIERKFNTKIENLFNEKGTNIESKDTQERINKIQEEVINECYEKYNFFDESEIQGMLYMLAGHCHIKWVP